MSASQIHEQAVISPKAKLGTGVEVGPYATVGGGKHNTASGTYSVVAGGVNGTAGATTATIAGGDTNTASGLSAAVYPTPRMDGGSPCWPGGQGVGPLGSGLRVPTAPLFNRRSPSPL